MTSFPLNLSALPTSELMQYDFSNDDCHCVIMMRLVCECMNPAASHKRNSKTKWTEFYIKSCTAICNKHNNKTNKKCQKYR